MTEQKWNIGARSIATIALSTPFLAAAAPARDYFDRADLQAQQDMATWAAVMTVSAWLGLIISLVGVILLWRTLAETRRAADLTVNEAKETVKAARLAVAAEHRPWLKVRIRGSTSWSEANGIASLGISLNVENVGRSPVDNYYMVARLAAGPGYLDDAVWQSAPPISTVYDHRSIVYPGEIVSVRGTISISLAEVAAAREADPNAMLSLVVGVEYSSPYLDQPARTMLWSSITDKDDVPISLDGDWWAQTSGPSKSAHKVT